MITRILPLNQYHLVKKIFEDNGGRLPDPGEWSKNIIVTQTESGEIIAMAVYELVPHLGPIWVKEDLRRRGLCSRLIKYIEEAFTSGKKHTGYYMFPSTDISKALAKKLGLQKMDWEVWKREY